MVIKNVSAKSGRYFGEQQKNLGIENGFIEEMMSGQKSGQGLCSRRRKHG